MSSLLQPLLSPIPTLRSALDKRVSPPLTSLVQSHEIAVVATLAVRSQQAVTSRIERASRRLLHVVNLPAASDINRLLRHMAQVERQVRDLRNELDDLRTELAASPTTPAASNGARPRKVATPARPHKAATPAR